MAIQVICPGCHGRFKVSDKFAGKKGPCPKCKVEITVPKPTEEVVIHAPEHSEVGAKSASGTLVLKPLERRETTLTPLQIAAIAGAVMLVAAVAFILRLSGGPSLPILALGAVVLAPPLCWGGYTFLRSDEELQPFRGPELIVRTLACAAIYATLWGLYTYFYGRLFGTDPAEIVNLFFLAPPLLLIGAFTAYCCYDLDLGSGFFHYSLYLLVTIGLRLVMGLSPL